MSARHTKFYLDKQNKKWKGVCAGIADYTGVDVTIIRIGLVVLTFVGGFPWTFIAYWVAAWMAPVKPRELAIETPELAKFWQGVRASPTRTAADIRSRLRDVDRRLADIESYVTTENRSLAREIDQLR